MILEENDDSLDDVAYSIDEVHVTNRMPGINGENDISKHL